jgi:hypothetical protein
MCSCRVQMSEVNVKHMLYKKNCLTLQQVINCFMRFKLAIVIGLLMVIAVIHYGTVKYNKISSVFQSIFQIYIQMRFSFMYIHIFY